MISTETDSRTLSSETIFYATTCGILLPSLSPTSSGWEPRVCSVNHTGDNNSSGNTQANFTCQTFMWKSTEIILDVSHRLRESDRNSKPAEHGGLQNVLARLQNQNYVLQALSLYRIDSRS